MTGALDYYGFAVLFSEVPTHYSSVKVFVFYSGGFRGDRTAALFYRTQDLHRTQDSGRRTTGPGLDPNVLIFQGEIPSAAYCRLYQMTWI